MSEPKSRVKKIDTIVPGVLHWSLHDDRIDANSHAYAVQGGGKTVLIDPLPLEESALPALGKVEAICITDACHQRSAWRYRKQFGVKVYAPEGVEGLEEKPDIWYREGDTLPGGLKAIHAPGMTATHHAFHLERGGGALFCADLLTHEKGKIAFLPDQYQADPKRTRETVRKFLDLEFATLCFDHGDPITKEPHAAIRKALKEDQGK